MFDPGNMMIKFRSRISGLSRDTGWQLGLTQSFFSKARGARILVYHGICREDHLRFNTLFIKLKTFESQLKLYKKYFNLVSLDDFYLQRFHKDRFNICLTFDDGFANNYRYVLPLLERYRVPAAFFITGIREAGHDILWNDVLCIAGRYGPEKITLRDENFIKSGNKAYISAITGKRLADVLRSDGFEEKAQMIELLGVNKYKAPDD